MPPSVPDAAGEGGGGGGSGPLHRRKKLSPSRGSGDCAKLARGVRAEEVAAHDRPHDCWLIVQGKVYDVTQWVPKHPGGAMIYVHAGRDCTQLFESYHPLYVRKMLHKFYVGDLVAHGQQRPSSGSSPAPAEEEKGGKVRGALGALGGQLSAPEAALGFKEEEGERDFYTVLKQRVESYFTAHKIDPRVHPHMYAKACLILIGYMFAFWGAYMAPWSRGPWGMLYATCCAALLGFLTAEVGLSIQHDCNHGAFSTSPWLSYAMGLTLDCVGASSFMWKQQHVVGHHVATNVDKFDPDIRVSDPDVRRVTPQQPHRWYHQYQHVYLMALYGLLALKSVFADDFSAYFSGRIGPLKLARMTPSEEALFWGSKMIYFLYTFGLPALAGQRTVAQFIVLYLLCQFITGWMLACLFQVAHVVPEAEFPVPDSSKGAPSLPQTWAAFQVATSTDFSQDSWLWLHISGGLNLQIEHHLFPGVCHVYYPQIQPIVEQTCKEFGVPYHSYPSYWTALKAHIQHLQTVGISAEHLQLLG